MVSLTTVLILQAVQGVIGVLICIAVYKIAKVQVLSSWSQWMLVLDAEHSDHGKAHYTYWQGVNGDIATGVNHDGDLRVQEYHGFLTKTRSRTVNPDNYVVVELGNDSPFVIHGVKELTQRYRETVIDDLKTQNESLRQELSRLREENERLGHKPREDFEQSKDEVIDLIEEMDY